MWIHAVSDLLVGTCGLVLVLVCALVAKRLWRNATELNRAARRARYAAVLRSTDRDAHAGLAREAAAHSDRVLDLAVEFDRMWPELSIGRRAELLDVLCSSPLVDVLVANTRSQRMLQRSRAAAALGHLRLPVAVAELPRLLTDGDPQVRLVAARALARTGTLPAAWALIGGLSDEVLPEQRLIELLGAPWAAHALLIAFHSPRFDTVRAGLAEALGLAQIGSAVKPIAAALPRAGAEERVRMVRALGRLRTPAAAAPVITAMRDPAWEVRAQAARSLGRIGDPAATPALERGLADPSWWVRANCGVSLGTLGADGVAALRRALTSDDRFARDRARETLDLMASRST